MRGSIFHRHYGYRSSVPGGGGRVLPYFTVTTTAPNQTLTLNSLHVATDKAVTVRWGDGQSNDYTGSGERTHQYAAAGVYHMTIDDPLDVARIDFRDEKLACRPGTLSQFPNIHNMYISGAGIEVAAGELAVHDMTHLNIVRCPKVAVGANDLAGYSDLTVLTIDRAPLVEPLRGFENHWALTTLRYENGLAQADVDRILFELYEAFPHRLSWVSGGTIDLLGNNNEAPTGTLQAACPPTTGREVAYELVNDSCDVSAKHWTSVSVADNPDVELPTGMLLSEPTYIDEIEDYTAWTGLYGFCAVSNETTLVKHGTAAVRFAPTVAGGTGIARMPLTPQTLFETSDTMSIWLYLDATHQSELKKISFYFSNTADFSQSMIKSYDGNYLFPGWNQIDLSKTLVWSVSNGGTFDEDIVGLQIRIEANAGYIPEIVLDALEYGGTYQPGIILCFDDGAGSVYDIGYPILASRNMAATAYIISSSIDNDGSMTTAQLQALDAAGWDICNHTHTHPRLTDVTPEEAGLELRNCRLFLESIGVGDAARHVAYPGQAYNQAVLDQMEIEGMVTGRGGDSAGLDLRLVHPYRYRTRGVGETTTLEQAKAYIDAAVDDEKVLFLTFHYLAEDGADPLTYGQWHAGNLRALLDYIIARHVQPLTITQAYALRSGPVTVKRPW